MRHKNFYLVAASHLMGGGQSAGSSNYRYAVHHRHRPLGGRHWRRGGHP